MVAGARISKELECDGVEAFAKPVDPVQSMARPAHFHQACRGKLTGQLLSPLFGRNRVVGAC